MGQVLLLVVVALTVAAVVFGVTVLVTGGDNGLGVAEPDGRAVPLPGSRPLMEGDVAAVRFDTTVRGYRMGQVDQALRRAAYDIGYKEELISVLEAEVIALRDGREGDADVLRRAREAALVPAGGVPEKAASEPAALGVEVAPATEKPTAKLAEKPAEVPAEKPAEEPAEEPVEKAAEKLADQDQDKDQDKGSADGDGETPADESPARS